MPTENDPGFGEQRAVDEHGVPCPPDHDPSAWAKGYGIPARIGPPQSIGYRHEMPEPREFSDQESSDLLRSLYCYILYYDTITSDSISELVTDLAQSQGVTSDVDDQIRRALEIHFKNYADAT